jgi:group II intron reverse transcriptase/maturase
MRVIRGDGVPVVVVGVASDQSGDRESRTTGRRGAGDWTNGSHGVCVMQRAEVVLEVLRERGRKSLPCDELYRQMFNKDLYLVAWGNIYPNRGAMTPGADGRTADGMSEAEIDRIIGRMRQEKYRFSPARRVYIPKKNGSLRPLGMPVWADKIVGEVVRLILEAYYEPQFSESSHGFRRQRGCHTALQEIQHQWTGTSWFIEGDISDCFGSLDHQVMLSILAEKIRDNRFLRLISGMLKAGYLEDWKYHPTFSGCPQGGVVSPILSNIYLHKLDEHVERVLIPRYTRGYERRANPEYRRCNNRRWGARQRGDRAEAQALLRRMRDIPSRDTMDPGYRRLKFSRYADDHILGFIGPKAEAEEIKGDLARFLRDELKLELNQEKTLITHARTQRARFLGYDIAVRHSASAKITRGRRSTNGQIVLLVPPDAVKAKCAPYRNRGKPAPRNRLVHLRDYDIVQAYGEEYRGIVNYYLLAHDVWRLAALQWQAQTSMLKTLASKHNSTVTKMAARYRATIETSHGKRRCYEARIERQGKKDLVARFGGIPLRRNRMARIADPLPAPIGPRRKELAQRVTRHWCELCEQGSAMVEVHQVTTLKSLGQSGPNQPAWAVLMARMRRKTLIVCAMCHERIHATPITHAA